MRCAREKNRGAAHTNERARSAALFVRASFPPLLLRLLGAHLGSKRVALLIHVSSTPGGLRSSSGSGCNKTAPRDRSRPQSSSSRRLGEAPTPPLPRPRHSRNAVHHEAIDPARGYRRSRPGFFKAHAFAETIWTQSGVSLQTGGGVLSPGGLGALSLCNQLKGLARPFYWGAFRSRRRPRRARACALNPPRHFADLLFRARSISASLRVGLLAMLRGVEGRLT